MNKISVSIRDVARETGLSTATISRVINGGHKVSDETRRQVLDACARLDYLPNPAARALSTSRTKAVAAIIPTIEHSVFAKFITAVEHTLAERGYSLIIAISNADEVEELAAARKLLGMGADAFILSGQVHSDALLGMLGRRQVPFVFTSVWDADSTRPTIGYDNAALAQAALDHLRGLGHRRVAVVHGPLGESDRTRARRAGAETMRDAFEALAFFETPVSVAGGKAGAAQALHAEGAFTSLLCSSDVIALGAYFALAEAGLQVPDDISVMGFDNLDWASAVAPPLTTLDLPAIRMGEVAAAQIVDFLEDDVPLRSELLPAEVIARGSVRNLD
ncbi:MAG: LacI family DNA-binding transcriptional regulator [Pseudomonadota bacterium]